MTDKAKKAPRISEILIQDDIRPLEGLMEKYRREIDCVKKALDEADPKKAKPSRKSLD
jgi:hypothetical protein